jgi:thiosulfate/3-mercaptopyruvate sulfurtransferase
MQPLISATELRGILGAPDLVILDVRWALLGPPGRSAYDDAHLPGAVFVDLETELTAPPDHRGRHPLPDWADFEADMRRAGVSGHSRVVCYDAADGTAASRLWWLLRYVGHDAVQVLDGGYDGWVAGGGSTSRAVPAPVGGDLVARPGHLPLVDATGAAAIARAGCLLDARAQERYSGEKEPVDPVAGHIPGAVSAPTSGNVDGSGHFLSADQLRRRFVGLGVAAGGDVAAYCGSGVTAAQVVLALELAGFEAALYADSWSGWITDPSRPVAVGPEQG